MAIQIAEQIVIVEIHPLEIPIDHHSLDLGKLIIGDEIVEFTVALVNQWNRSSHFSSFWLYVCKFCHSSVDRL